MNNLEAIKLITTKPGTVVSREGSVSVKFENGKFLKRVKDSGQFLAISDSEKQTLGLFKYNDQDDWYENDTIEAEIKLEAAIKKLSGFNLPETYLREFTTALKEVVAQQ